MKGMILGITLAAISGAFAFGHSAPPIQDKWKPYQFAPGERYEFKITQFTGTKKDPDRKKECFYAIEIKPTVTKDEAGEEAYEVSYTTRGFMKKGELGEKAVFGDWAMGGYSTMWAMSAAMFAVYFKDLTLKEGEKLSLFGAGLIKVTGKEKIAEREGFTCQFWGKKGETEVLQQEWVIDPALALPIKTVFHDNGKIKHSMELVSYKKS